MRGITRTICDIYNVRGIARIQYDVHDVRGIARTGPDIYNVLKTILGPHTHSVDRERYGTSVITL